MRPLLIAVLLATASSEAGDRAKADEAERARALLSQRMSDVKWRPATALRADVTLDGKADVVMLGVRGMSAVVAVVAGPVGAKAQHWALTFDEKADALCGPAAGATLALEALELPLEEWGCTPDVHTPDCESAKALEKRFAAASRHKGSRAFALSTGDCDAFHIHFDGTRLAWWRR